MRNEVYFAKKLAKITLEAHATHRNKTQQFYRTSAQFVMQSLVLAMIAVSVCLSVCPSGCIARWRYVESSKVNTTQTTITK